MVIGSACLVRDGSGGKRKEICIYTQILSVLKTKLLHLGFHLGDFLALASAQSLRSNSTLGLLIAYPFLLPKPRALGP